MKFTLSLRFFYCFSGKKLYSDFFFLFTLNTANIICTLFYVFVYAPVIDNLLLNLSMTILLWGFFFRQLKNSICCFDI